MTMRSMQRGFTLIELMIVVTIIGLLAAVAIPGYAQYVRRAHRSEGMAALSALAAAQEKYYLSNNTYTSDISDLKMSDTTEHGYYTLKITAADATAFTALAAPGSSSPQLEDTDCQVFTLNSAGSRTSTNASSGDSTADCWR
jgi:type IV pilus assembly protein PilE